MIEVFVRSFSQYMDVELYREMSQHTYCAPETVQGLVSQALSKFRGRVLPQDDHRVLEEVCQMAEKTNEKLKVYDFSRIADRMRALKRGVLKTPTVIINGERYEGLEEISQVILSKSGL
jgi:hypothetical protein